MGINYRKDTRTAKQFAKDIKEYTRKERLWAYIFKLELKHQNFDVSYESNGIDNTGKVVKTKANSKPDYIFFVNNKEKFLEIKTYNFNCPQFNPKFLTYKVSSLKACKNAYILTVNKDWFLLFKPEFITDYLLDKNKHPPHIFYPFSPNDKVIRIFPKEIKKYIKNKLIYFQYWKGLKTIEKIKEYEL